MDDVKLHISGFNKWSGSDDVKGKVKAIDDKYIKIETEKSEKCYYPLFNVIEIKLI